MFLPITTLVLSLAIFATIIFLTHLFSLKFNRGIYILLIVGLWFLTYILGHFDLRLSINFLNITQLNVRYSTAFYTLIFIGILLVYITEGANAAKNLIYISIGSQFFILCIQIFMYYFVSDLVVPPLQQAVEPLFKPSYLRAFGSIIATIVALFSALLTYQYLENQFTSLNRFVLISTSLVLAMFIDTLLFLCITRFSDVHTKFVSYFLIKSVIVCLFTLPLEFYLRYFQKKHKIIVKKGTIDIFRKLESLEEELARNNKQLAEYNRNLEHKVKERTQEIEEKQKMTEIELNMASEVQIALLPELDKLKNIKHNILYRPYAIVSGDLYDFALIRDNILYLLIADISGHGIPTVLAWSLCNMVLSRSNFSNQQPVEIIKKLSDEVLTSKIHNYLSAFIAFIDLKNHVMTYVNAGHVPPVLISRDRKQQTILEPNSSLVGVPSGEPFIQTKLRYKQDTRLLLYTDCITESREHSSKEEFGLDRLQNFVSENLSRTPEEFNQELLRTLNVFTNKENFSDDLTVITIDIDFNYTKSL